jgi:glucokinase
MRRDKEDNMMLLAGDLGGTKTNLAIFSSEDGPRQPLVQATLPSSQYPSLEALVREFLAQVDFKPQWATFGVAGPVVSGKATITNLPWVMDETQLAKAFDIPSVQLINDLVAIAQAVPWLETDELYTLNEGRPVEGGAIVVNAPGTGLGQAFLIWDGSRYRAHPSQGGHTDFAPTNDFEIELLRFLMSRFEHVSYERVCAGIGLPNIYDFLKQAGYAEEPPWLAERLAQAGDRTPIIVQAALDDKKPCELCAKTLNTFVSLLGTETGNLALKVLATGGVYLGGGIPPRILPALEDERFLGAFRRKGRMSDLMVDMPVRVILHPEVALLGAASYGLAL